MRRGRHRALVAVLTGVLLALRTAPAEAHPLTGGPASPGQIAVTVVGLVLVVLGGAGAFSSAGPGPRRGLSRLGKTAGVPALLLGLMTVFLGPDVVVRVNSRCSVRPSSPATLRVISPAEGERFTSNAVPLQIEVTGGEVAPASLGTIEEGKGHLQVRIDRILVTRAGNPVQVLQVPDGRHEIVVEYVAGDFLPFCPKASVTRTVEVAS
ncbi:MAG: hypothetical protein ACRDKW_03680 [Actinomycetota bacterium]